MKANGTPMCERVQMAAMAQRDGERADLTAVEIEAHLAGCADCRTAVSALAALQSPLDHVDYESLEADVWPAVHEAITSQVEQARTERRFMVALAAVLAVWRLAQLSVDLPAPVVNSVVPLALTVLVLWRVTGDPFAIQSTAHQFQEDGV